MAGQGRQKMDATERAGMNLADQFLLKVLEHYRKNGASVDEKGLCLVWEQRIQTRIASRTEQPKTHGNFASIFSTTLREKTPAVSTK